MSIASAAASYLREAGHRVATRMNEPGPAVPVTPMTGESYSPQTAALNLGLSILAGARNAANYRQQMAEKSARLEYTRALTAQINAKLNAPAPATYTLTTPERTSWQDLGAGQEGPPTPTTLPSQQISFTDPREFSQESARWFPPEKQDQGMTEFQRESIDLRRQGLNLARERLTRGAAERSQIPALNSAYAKVPDIVAGEKSAFAGRKMTEANELASRANNASPKYANQARRMLGLPDVSVAPKIPAATLAAARDRYIKRTTTNYEPIANQKIESRRSAIRSKIDEAAGLEGEDRSGAAIDALLEDIQRLKEE